MIEEELREPARCKPRETAVVAGTPEGVSPVTVEPVPSKKCRVRCRTGHRLDGITHEFANVPELDHPAATIFHSMASAERPTPRSSFVVRLHADSVQFREAHR